MWHIPPLICVHLAAGNSTRLCGRVFNLNATCVETKRNYCAWSRHVRRSELTPPPPSPLLCLLPSPTHRNGCAGWCDRRCQPTTSFFYSYSSFSSTSPTHWGIMVVEWCNHEREPYSTFSPTLTYRTYCEECGYKRCESTFSSSSFSSSFIPSSLPPPPQILSLFILLQLSSFPCSSCYPLLLLSLSLSSSFSFFSFLMPLSSPSSSSSSPCSSSSSPFPLFSPTPPPSPLLLSSSLTPPPCLPSSAANQTPKKVHSKVKVAAADSIEIHRTHRIPFLTNWIYSNH